MCNLLIKETEISQKRSKGIKNWKVIYSVILSVLSKTNLILGFSSPLTKKWLGYRLKHLYFSWHLSEVSSHTSDIRVTFFHLPQTAVWHLQLDVNSPRFRRQEVLVFTYSKSFTSVILCLNFALSHVWLLIVYNVSPVLWFAMFFRNNKCTKNWITCCISIAPVYWSRHIGFSYCAALRFQTTKKAKMFAYCP